ncbi:hypothetical protein Goshw_023970, partial [Gossypium schwendimanii]|nr:hypothetical protein [Gossypium lobatum]MBA0856144.1 hypothetical protein [Gossypium schwendimanii]
SAFATEALTVIHGLRFAFELGFQSVVLEGDSRSVIEKIYVDISGNRAALAMARDRVRRGEDRYWVEESPDSIVMVTNEDRRLLDPP